MLEIVTVIGTAMTEIETVLSAYTRKFNQKLETYFPVSEAPEQKAVAAMRYSILNGGKRLRRFCCMKRPGCSAWIMKRRFLLPRRWKCFTPIP